MTLATLPAGEPAVVSWVHDQSPTGERLLEMGLTPGAAVTVIRRPLFRGPIQVRVRGAVLSLRPAEASAIEVAC